MPNVQFSLTTAELVELYQSAELLGVSEGRLAKAVCLAYLRGIDPNSANLLMILRPKIKKAPVREML